MNTYPGGGPALRGEKSATRGGGGGGGGQAVRGPEMMGGPGGLPLTGVD